MNINNQWEAEKSPYIQYLRAREAATQTEQIELDKKYPEYAVNHDDCMYLFSKAHGIDGNKSFCLLDLYNRQEISTQQLQDSLQAIVDRQLELPFEQ